LWRLPFAVVLQLCFASNRVSCNSLSMANFHDAETQSNSRVWRSCDSSQHYRRRKSSCTSHESSTQIPSGTLTVDRPTSRWCTLTTSQISWVMGVELVFANCNIRNSGDTDKYTPCLCTIDGDFQIRTAREPSIDCWGEACGVSPFRSCIMRGFGGLSIAICAEVV
jgi:hypothetical protein